MLNIKKSKHTKSSIQTHDATYRFFLNRIPSLVEKRLTGKLSIQASSRHSSNDPLLQPSQHPHFLSATALGTG